MFRKTDGKTHVKLVTDYFRVNRGLGEFIVRSEFYTMTMDLRVK